MNTRWSAIAGLALALAAAPVATQETKVRFDGQKAYEIVKTLSADAMLGRKAGEPGGKMGADYVAARFREWGLEPAGDKGTFFQDMTVEYNEVERGASLAFTAHNRTREFVYGEDWRQYRYSGSGLLASGIVFVGYGISAPGAGYDDYAGVDVRNRTVLLAIETPARLAASAAGEAQLANRIKAARAHGARGVLTFRNDGQTSGGFFRGTLTRDLYQADFPVLTLETKVIDFLFKWQQGDPRYYFQQIDRTGRPQSFDLGSQVLLNMKVTVDEKRATQNVLAKITGSDPALRNEYVIVGGHMDHLGVDMTGDILNGADDDASGTAVVMETARAMKTAGFVPKRTIVFAAWAAEEMGLLGSKWYTEHPIYPLEKTVANINLDMEGHGTGKVGASGAYYAPETWAILKGSLPKPVLDNAIPGRGGPGGSDHTHFLYNGIPAFMVSTDGPHFKTNRVGDVIDHIRPEILQASGDFVVASTMVLSTDPRIPIVPSRKELFYWRFESMVNHQATTLDEALRAHKDAQDPDVDMQFVTVGAKAGGGDALRLAIMKELLGAKDRVDQTAGLSLYGAPAQAGAPMMGPRGPSKTTLLLGLDGAAALAGDRRWAGAFAREGLAYVALDKQSELFAGTALSAEGTKTIEAIGSANLLAVVKGFSNPQLKALLGAAKKPVFVHAATLPDADVLALVKSTASTVGLVLGKAETPAAYFARLDAARKAVGNDAVAIVGEASLWVPAAQQQMLGVIGEMLKAGYGLEDLANVTSGALTRALNRARMPEPVTR